MFDIRFYKSSDGTEPVREYIKDLKQRAKTDKNARVHFEKITDYLTALQTEGTFIGEPITKHIDGDLWELRPLDDRIFFFCWNGTEFVLLHHFKKQGNKTPANEKKIAQNRMKEITERGKI